MKKNNLAIVGAGICGLYAAYRLAQKGFEVTVFEKKSAPFGKVCSGLISARLGNFIKIEKDFVLNQIDKCLINYPQKQVELTMEPVHYVLDRNKINQRLMDLGRQAGVNYQFGREIVEIPPGFSQYIFCDGAYSRAEKELAMASGDFYLGIQFISEEKDSQNYVQTWAHKSGFYWRIPRGRDVEYGVMGEAKGLMDSFEKFCQEKKWPYQREKIHSALIPHGLRKVISGNMAVCGDAAGLCKPWSGGGVIWGLTAADILAENFPDLEKYNKKIQALFRPAIARGNLAKKLTGFLGFNLPFLLPARYRRDNDFPLL